MNSVRVLLTNALDIYGGGEFFILQLSDFLRRQGQDVWVSCVRNTMLHEKCSQKNVYVFPLNYPRSGKGKLIEIVRELKHFIRKNRVQIVHTNTNYDRTAGAFAAKLTGALHITSVHSLHSICHNLTHWYRNKFLTAHFIADGDNIRKVLVGKDKIPVNRATTIHPGIDPESMRRKESLRQQVRKEFNIEDKHVLIGNVGRMVEFKGQEHLIRAFSRLAGYFPEARLMIVGTGKLQDELSSLTKSLDTADKVIFPGFRDDMQAIYSAFDIYAHTSVEGGGELSPFAVLYALAASLPVVATSAGDIGEMVKDGLNGFIVPERDQSVAADKLFALVQEPELRYVMGCAGLELMREKFTLSSMGSSILKLYSDVLRIKESRSFDKKG